MGLSGLRPLLSPKFETPSIIQRNLHLRLPEEVAPDYDIALDGQRFVFIAQELNVTEVNWFEELKERVPAE